MRKQIFFLSVGLILLALCSCDKSMQNETETNATKAKAQKRATTTMFQPSELGNFVVNPDLDVEFQLSEDEIVEELMSYGFLDANESVEITPLYSERIIPLFFKSLIVEPESNEWYGIDVDEVRNMYMEFPSIAFYIINSLNNKSFITTADRRFPCNLIDYRSSERFDPEIITVQENLINELYEGGISIYKSRWDSMLRADHYRLIGLDISDDRFELKVCYWRFEVCKIMPTPYLCEPTGQPWGVGPWLSEDMRWGQNEIFGDCDAHDVVSGNIAVSILKILCLHGYSGSLVGDYFDGAAYRNHIDILNYFAWQLYSFIESSGENRSQTGIEILNSCGFNIEMSSAYSTTDILSRIEAGKMSIVETWDGCWLLINGYWVQENTCSSEYKFFMDRSMCASNEQNLTSYVSFNKVYYYTY